MYIVVAILLLAILIMVHEFGHFTAARLMKIDVTEFSIGFGPRLLGWTSRKHETKFSVRAVPLGGYCAFFGEDDAKGITKDDPRAFAKQNVWKRMFVILMGPVMNFVLAFVVTLVFIWCAGINVPVDNEYYPYISEVSEGGAAEAAGAPGKSIVLEINGQSMQSADEDSAVLAFQNAVKGWQEGDEPLRMKVQHNGDVSEFSVSPVWDAKAERMMVGVMLAPGQLTTRKMVGVGEGIREAWEICVDAGGTIIRVFKELVASGDVLKEASGPVGIVSYVSEQVQIDGIYAFVDLLIVISINLGLMNLLPIPGLDGSRLVFGIIEVIRRKPIPPEKEAMVHLAGMVLLFGLMIFFTYKDIVKLIG